MTQASWSIDLSGIQQRIAARQRQLARLSERLAEREQRLTELRTELAAFEQEFFSRIGRRYAELDVLKARAAELRAAHDRDAEHLQFQARRARFRARQSENEFRSRSTRPETSPPQAKPSADLKRLYRQVAAEIHPDKAEDEPSRVLRNRLMAELNAAYAAGDKGRMQQIRHEWQSSPEAVVGSGDGHNLERLERAIARLRNKIAALDRRIGQLKLGNLYQTMQRAGEALRSGKDLLAEMARDLDEQIALFHCILAELERSAP